MNTEFTLKKTLATLVNEANIFAPLSPEQRKKVQEFKMKKDWNRDNGAGN